jgi:LysM repeat protein
MNIRPYLFLVGFCVALTSCASTPQKTKETHISPISINTPLDRRYTVQANDILYSIAEKTTGNGENWQELAHYNHISNPRKIKVGDVLLVPGHLALNQPSPKTSRTTKNKKPTTTTQPKKTPNAWVVVKGSYYPKAVYREAHYVGGLLVRVLPGTTLPYVSKDKDWIEVQTDKGAGFIHSSDAQIMSGHKKNRHPAQES